MTRNFLGENDTQERSSSSAKHPACQFRQYLHQARQTETRTSGLVNASVCALACASVNASANASVNASVCALVSSGSAP